MSTFEELLFIGLLITAGYIALLILWGHLV